MAVPTSNGATGARLFPSRSKVYLVRICLELRSSLSYPVRHLQPFDGLIDPFAGALLYTHPHLHLQTMGMSARTALALTKYAA